MKYPLRLGGTRGLLAVPLVVLAFPAFVYPAEHPQTVSYKGTVVAPESSSTIVLRDLPPFDTEAAPKYRPAPPRLPLPHELPPKDEAGAVKTAPSPLFGLNAVDGEKTGDVTASFEALPDGGAVPPDVNGAAGPAHLVTALNDRVRVQERDGTVLSTVGLGAFWSSLGASGPFDPRIIFDPLADRFLFVVESDRMSADSSVLFAVSATADPTGVWHMWRFDADAGDTTWADFPYIGMTEDKITFTTLLFTISGNSLSGSKAFVVDKSSALDGGALDVSEISIPFQGGLSVCVTHDAGITTQYLVKRVSGSFGGESLLELSTITGPALSAVLTPLSPRPSGPTWNLATVDAPQLGGGADSIETNDSRIQNSVYRNGSIWTTHTIYLPDGVGAPNRASVQWWEIDPATRTAIQVGRVDDPTGNFSYYYPSIGVNKFNEVLLGFSGSSFDTYVSAYCTSRTFEMAPGATKPLALLKEGLGTYTRPRWGDYTTTMVDPVDDVGLWTIQQYADEGNKWGTWWSQITGATAMPPATPLSTMGLAGYTGAGLLIIALFSVVRRVRN